MKKQKSNLTHNSVPASVGLVKAVRDELRADIRAVEHGLRAEIRAVELGLRAAEHGLSSKIDKVMVSVHCTQVLMEEQRGENRIVLDGLKTVIERQDRIETDFNELRDTVSTLSAGAKR